MKKVLITAPYMLRESELPKVKQLLDQLEIEYHLADVEERLEEAELLEIIAQYDGVICGDDRFTPAVYAAAKNLKVVVKWGTGIDSLNQPEAEKHGIQLFRTPGAFTEPVADTTLGMMLTFVRKLRENDQIIKQGGWDKPQGWTLGEKTIGLIGFGDIGRAVAKRLKAFNTEVLAYDNANFGDDIYASNYATRATLDQVFMKSDIISTHCDLNQASHHILNKQAFDKMPRQPWIINTARGPLVCEKDIIAALQLGQIAGAGMDVFENEPLAKDCPLRSMENVILSSHNSNSSPKSWERVHQNSIDMLIKGLQL